MQSLKATLFLALIFISATTFAKNESCKIPLSKQLEKSVGDHDEWLKKYYSKIDEDPDIRTNIIAIKELTHQLRRTFDSLIPEDKSVLYSSKKIESLESDALFEELLKQTHFQTKDSAPEKVAKFVSISDEMNWSLVQPLYKMLAEKAKTKKGKKVWHDKYGLEIETQINHDRSKGEFLVSICSRYKKEHACTTMNIRDGTIQENCFETAKTKSSKKSLAMK